MERNSQGTVDSLDFSSVLEQQEIHGMKATFIVPTDVTGQTSDVSILTLKNQLRDAKRRIMEQGQREATANEWLVPVAELVESAPYWRQQSRSLVVFVAEGFMRSVRVPVELSNRLTIGESFNLLPLAPVLASDRKLYVLALAKNSVRLFDSTRNVIEELSLQTIPESFDEVVDELPERVIDIRPGSAGTEGTASHHGPDGDIDRMLLERFIRVVGHEVGVRLGTARSQQLVLAAVAEYHPIFASACPYPAIFSQVIAGNHEHTQPDDLRSAAWQLVNAHETAQEAEEEDAARSAVHAGKGSIELAEIAAAAEIGRVDTLFLPRDDTEISGETDRELANRALLGTLHGSGTLRTLGTIQTPGLATFRY